MTADNRETVTLAMTGASGSQYAWRLMECLVAGGSQCVLYDQQGRTARVGYGDRRFPARTATIDGELSDG